MARRAPGARPRAYLLWGPEDVRKREALDRLIAELVPAEDRELDVQYMDATNANVTGESILNAARDRAMFSETRVVVLLNAGRLKASRHQRTQEVLAEGLRSLPEYSTLIFLAYAEESEGRSRTLFNEKLTAAIRAVGEVREFARLKPDELKRMATEEAAALGKTLTPPAAAMLVDRVGTDSRRLLQEVAKLAAFAGDEKAITPQHVAELVAARPEDSVWNMLNAAMDGNRANALGLMRQLRQSGSAVPQILGLLAMTLRQAVQAKYLQDQGIGHLHTEESVPPEVAARLPEERRIFPNPAHPWAREQLWKRARGLSWGQLQHAVDRLAVTEAGTKGWERGIEDPDLALEHYLISLCDAVQSNAPASRRRA